MVRGRVLVKDIFSEIPEDKHIAIIGAPKCGTCSLQKYLQERFPDKTVVRTESIFKGERGVKEFKDNHSDKVAVIITRDDVKRIWSQYNYFALQDKMTLKEYLEYDLRDKEDIFASLGKGNPIKQAQWDYWFKIWEEVNPIITTLEECQKLEGFPHENKTADRRHYPDITDEDRELIERYLNGSS